MTREKQAGSTEYQGMILRLLRRYPARVAEYGLDPDALTQLREIQRELDEQVGQTVARLRENGFTWLQIADALGIKKPAAIRKYGGIEVDESKVRRPGGQPPGLR